MIDLKAKRFQRVLHIAMLLLACCLIGIFLSRAGVGIPCVFHVVTGWDCPGCGITRMLRALLQGDIAAAWRFNPLVFAIAPLLLILMLRLSIRYIKCGAAQLTRKENIAVWVLVACVCIFGMLRNMPFYPY